MERRRVSRPFSTEPPPNMPSPVTKEQVLQALRVVKDPDLFQDIVSLGFVTQVAIEGSSVRVTINLTTPACPVKDLMKGQAEAALRAVPGVGTVEIDMTATVRGAAGPPRQIAPNIKHIVAVASGKGGVGKSTVTVNLGVALAKRGERVGILDCDVYGPDIPIMMGLEGEPETLGKKLLPKLRHGVKTMSMGFLLPDDKPIIWRGPMVHKLIEQFLADVEWGDLDYLVVDMPPGTGDAQLSLAQIVPLSGAVLVTTPQSVSTYDVAKAISMFNQVHVDILGIVENMAGFVISGTVEGAPAGTPMSVNVGTGAQKLVLGAQGSFTCVVDVFGSGGADKLAQKYGFPVLGRIPLNPAVRVGGDAGDPVTISAPDSKIAREFLDVAGRFAQRLAIKEHRALPILQ
jgi:ATP-binding protein involved in chromosome partitioning